MSPSNSPGTGSGSVTTPGDGRAATFSDSVLEAELSKRGFVVVPLPDPAGLPILDELAERLYVDERHGFHASNLSGSHEYRRSVALEATPVIAAAAGTLFVDHEAYTASLLMKWPDADSAFQTHQDWTMVDEAKFRTVNVWCPLVDSTVANGAMRVLPGSHNVLRALRCSPMPPVGYQNPGWSLSWEDMAVVQVRRGEALVFDHALLHSSGPNLSGALRPAVAAAFKPREARLMHWYLPDAAEAELEVYEIAPEFFDEIDIGDRPAYRIVDRVPFTWEQLTLDDMLQRCAAAVSPATTQRRVDRRWRRMWR